MRRAIYTVMSVMSVMLSVAASLAAPPLRWDTQQANPKAADWYIYRGEAVDLMPRLVDGTRPAAITDTPATFRYRESGLEIGQYREIPATNVALGTWLVPWRAAHDSGATWYDYQLWIADGSDASARITGRIIMRDSIGVPPGGEPPPPVAGWATPADLHATSNALATAMQSLPPPPDLAPYLRRNIDNTLTDNFRFSFDDYSNHLRFTPFELAFGFLTPEYREEAVLTPQYLRLAKGESSTMYTRQAIATPSGSLTFPTGSGTIATTDDILPVVTTILSTSNSWLTISNAILSVHAITNPATPAAIVWSSAEAEEGIPPAVTNAIWSAISGLNNSLAAKADRAWGKYLPDGSPNPDPAYMTMFNAPATMFGSGVQWSTAGTFAALATPGATAFVASDKGGELRIGPDVTTNYFGYRMGGTYIVGTRTDGIKVTNPGQPGGYAELTYNSHGGDDYTIWFTPLLEVEWAPIEAIWVDDGTTVVATVSAETAGGYFRATTEASIDSMFISTMPALLEGGIFGDTNAPPVKHDSTITISSGGKTYRIIAQEVP